MTKQDLLAKLGDLLERDEALSGQEALESLDGWDSTAVISFMAMADEDFGVTLSPKDIVASRTVDDLAALLGVPA
jgi:acyl carrier protein